MALVAIWTFGSPDEVTYALAQALGSPISESERDVIWEGVVLSGAKKPMRVNAEHMRSAESDEVLTSFSVKTTSGVDMLPTAIGDSFRDLVRGVVLDNAERLKCGSETG